MPTYQYRCAKCGEEFELWQSIHDEALKRHPGCGGEVTKVFAPAGIVLKGSGFYRTDSRAGGRKGSGSKEEKEKQPAKDGAGAAGNGSSGDTESSSDSKASKGSTESTSDRSSSKGSKDAKPSKNGSSSP